MPDSTEEEVSDIKPSTVGLIEEDRIQVENVKEVKISENDKVKKATIEDLTDRELAEKNSIK